jgi:hypothetical protein
MFLVGSKMIENITLLVVERERVYDSASMMKKMYKEKSTRKAAKQERV